MRTKWTSALGLAALLSSSCTGAVIDEASTAGSSGTGSGGAGSTSSSSSGSGGEAPSPGVPFTVAAGLKDPSVILADETAIYWSNRGTNVDNEYPMHDGSIVKLLHGSDSPVVLVEGTSVDELAADSTYIYWAGDGGIRRVPKAGGAALVITDDPSWVQRLAVDEKDVFWTTGGSIVKKPKEGGPFKVLLPPSDSVHMRQIALDQSDVYFADFGTSEASFKDGTIGKISKSGGAVSLIATSQAGPWAVAVDDAFVYWSTTGYTEGPKSQTPGSVFKVPKSGGAPVLVADKQDTVYDLTETGGVLFWGNYGTGPIMKADGQSGAPHVLVPSETATSVAVGPALVYWVDPYGYENNTGKIRAVPR